MVFVTGVRTVVACRCEILDVRIHVAQPVTGSDNAGVRGGFQTAEGGSGMHIPEDAA